MQSLESMLRLAQGRGKLVMGWSFCAVASCALRTGLGPIVHIHRPLSTGSSFEFLHPGPDLNK